MALGVNSARHLSRARFPFLALSPYLSWSTGAPPIAQDAGEAKGAGEPPPALLSRSARSRPGASESKLLCSRRP